MFCNHFLIHGRRHISFDGFHPAFGPDQAFDHSGGYFGDFARRHKEYGGYFGGEVAVDMAHRAFVFVIGGRTDAAHDESCIYLTGVMHQKPVFKHFNFDVWEVVGNGAQHILPFSDGIGAAFVGINADGDDEFVKHRLRLPYHPQMPQCGRIETAGINGAARCIR